MRGRRRPMPMPMSMHRSRPKPPHRWRFRPTARPRGTKIDVATLLAVEEKPDPAIAKPKRTKSPLWAKFTVFLGILLMLGGAGAVVVVDAAAHTLNKAVPQADLLGNTVATDQTGHVDISGPINILLVGLDTRPDNTIGTRADSIIIAHIPASHDQVYLTSIPRDTQVPIPADPATDYSGSTEKINAAFLYGSWHNGGTTGGFQLLARTIENNWHIQFQAAAMINFTGFKDIVTKLGGVTMYVDEVVTSIHDGYKIVNGKTITTPPYVLNSDGTVNHAISGVTPVVYTIGWHHMYAWNALDYVRQRDNLPNADYDRERHQQQFISAVLKELYQKGLNDPTKLSDWLQSLSSAYVFSGSGIAPVDWLFALRQITPSSILMIKTNDGTYNTIYVHQGGIIVDEEVLSDTSKQLLEAIRTDNVPNFLEANPTWLISNSG